MPTVTTDLWGQDIALDASSTGLGQALVSAAGELALTDGVDTGVQDIRLRIFTRLGQLFYDEQFGSLIHDWILEENTAANRLGLEAELVTRIELDPRVLVGSVSARTLAWDMGRQVLGWVDPSHPAPRDSSWTDMFKSKAF